MAAGQAQKEDEVGQSTPPRTPRRRLPVITLLLCGVCVAVLIGIMARGDDQSWDRLAAWGYLPGERVWAGACWSLVTSAFVHLALWHVTFNVYWLWVFGGAVERTLGPLPYLAFVVVAAAVSSSVQLAVSDTTGHGASGIVYSLFGLMWASRASVPAFAEGLGRNAPLFWMWLIGCILATRLGIASIGNGAHVGGLLFGVLTAHGLVLKSAHRKAALGALASLMTLCVVTLFWAPWSGAWVGYKAYRAHVGGDYRAAISGYRRSIALGGQRVWALQNLALAYQAMGATDGYEATVEELRAVPDAAAQLEQSQGAPAKQQR